MAFTDGVTDVIDSIWDAIETHPMVERLGTGTLEEEHRTIDRFARYRIFQHLSEIEDSTEPLDSKCLADELLS